MKEYLKPETIVFKLQLEQSYLDVAVSNDPTDEFGAPKQHRLTDDSNADDLDEFIL